MDIEITNARMHNLKGVDVTILRNSLTVVTGLSGSGKSSLFKLITGEYEPTEGSVFLAGGKTLAILTQDGALSGDNFEGEPRGGMGNPAEATPVEHVIHAFPDLLAAEAELEALRDAGEYVCLTEREMLEEEIMLLEALDMRDDCWFFGTHPLNAVAVDGYFKEKDRIIAEIRTEMAEIGDDILDITLKRGSM